MGSCHLITWERNRNEDIIARGVKQGGKWLRSCSHECPCGFHTDSVLECACTPNAANRSKKRISGPLLDRINLFAELPRVEYEKLVEPTQAETSAKVHDRIDQSHKLQHQSSMGRPYSLTQRWACRGMGLL